MATRWNLKFRFDPTNIWVFIDQTTFSWFISIGSSVRLNTKKTGQKEKTKKGKDLISPGYIISGIDQAGQLLSLFLFLSVWGNWRAMEWVESSARIWIQWGCVYLVSVARAEMNEYVCSTQPVDMTMQSGCLNDVWVVFRVDAFSTKPPDTEASNCCNLLPFLSFFLTVKHMFRLVQSSWLTLGLKKGIFL